MSKKPTAKKAFTPFRYPKKAASTAATSENADVAVALVEQNTALQGQVDDLKERLATLEAAATANTDSGDGNGDPDGKQAD